MVQIGGAWDDSEAELSAEDLATLDGIWKTSSGEVVDSEAVTTLAVPVRPEVPAGADVQEEPAAGAASELEAAKAALDADAGPGVFPWREASHAQIAGQWKALREFVDWTVVAYRFASGEHKPCWWRHSNVVLEWAALRHLYDLSWNEEDAGSGPNNFNYWLAATRQRLVTAWNGELCKAQQHVEPWEAAVPTVIEDEEWSRLTGKDAPYVPPEQWPTRVEHPEEPTTPL